ncbi:hypothetical protein NNJEOMEG_02749 [Fundidesulfovibrio magnetotacticus]|uniref:DUF4136 domain-containing protein n=1 Tax=Fundidesulfovibrio magnetotacticus TaxID=2730080 RepID=A0A6V8LWC0_9BACT|nr:hypothetical protein [Fundidesulfovibrio magnetotacticus]GFK94901.1 hypothetical protein NNJEOMEG_02749 [Fundidesulfovibrio magnetotacticus]
MPSRFTRLPALFAALLLAVLSVGCFGASGLYTMRLDAYAEHLPYGKRFVVRPGFMDIAPDDKTFLACADMLAKALEPKGYTRAASLEEADLVVYLAWNVSENRHIPAESMPQGFAGHNARLLAFLDYTRELAVEAVDMARFKANLPKNVVWRMYVISTGPTSGMEKSMPYFAAAIAEYAGKSGDVSVEVDSDFTIRPVKPAPKPSKGPRP